MKRKQFFIQVLVGLVGVLLVIKLFMLQVVESAYKSAAESNIVEKRVEYPYRGLLFDRGGRLLVYNAPVYDLMILPRDADLVDSDRFCRLFNLPEAVYAERLREGRRYSQLKPLVMVKGLFEEEFARYQGYLMDFENLQVRFRTIRGYRYSSLSNALGYMAEIDKESLAQDSAGYYRQGDAIGKSGLEKYYEPYLRGRHGTRFKLVNAHGKEIGDFREGALDVASVPGEDLVLGMDITLQLYAERLMAGVQGSIVAIEPSTGEVLAFVSSPSYAPEALSGRYFKDNHLILSRDSLKPLFNRGLMAMYRPGSIFKIAQALVALEEGVIDAGTVFPCDRALLNCHYHAPSEGLRGAIANSCNPYFYRVMERYLGSREGAYGLSYGGIGGNLDRWQRAIQGLGFGQALGIDVPYEQTGGVPNSAFYDGLYGAGRWRYSTVYSLSIGEGENLVVPLQMANFACILANKGYYYVPHFVRQLGHSAEPLPQYTRKHQVPISRAHFDLVHEGMRDVVTYGTGQNARIEGIAVCGKTGSVENKDRPDHSVFIGYAPAEAPRIALSVYVEHGGEGGGMAAAMSGLIMEKYIRKDSAALRMEPYVLSRDVEHGGL